MLCCGMRMQDILASAVGLALVLAASTQVLAGIEQMREKR